MFLLRWAIVLGILALVAALFGFGGIASGLAGIAKVLFFVFLAGVIILILAGVFLARKITGPR